LPLLLDVLLSIHGRIKVDHYLRFLRDGLTSSFFVSYNMPLYVTVVYYHSFKDVTLIV